MILRCVIIIILLDLSYSFINHLNHHKSLYKYRNVSSGAKESPGSDWTSTLNLPNSNWDFHNFENLEKESQNKWDSEATYLKSIFNNINGNLSFDNFKLICDGPPYANGPSHMGHLLNRTIKDIKLRYWLSQGYVSIIVPGWDCHGLPIELKAKQAFGVENLMEKCESIAMESIKDQALSNGRLGCWGFWGLSYGTLLPLYKRLVQETFNYLKKKNIICRGPLPVLYSPNAQNIVADVEIEMKNVIRTCSYIPYEIKKNHKINFFKIDFDKLFIIAYTTEPWTLFGNQGLAISNNSKYNVYKHRNNLYIMNGINPYGDWPLVDEIMGNQLIGCEYTDPLSGNVNKIIDGENYVINDVGTGIIHLSGAHNHNDFQLLIKSGIESFRNVIDESGKLIDYPSISAYSNELDDILRSKIDILHLQNVVKKPFCRRTGGNIFTRIIDQYWLNTGELKSRVLKNMERINVLPNSAKNYLNKVILSRPNHWCLSRQRPWGCKIQDKNECLDVWFESGINWMYNNLVLEYLRNVFFPNNINQDPCNKNSGIVKLPDGNFTIGENSYYKDFERYVEDISIPFLESKSKYLMIEGQDQHRGWFQSSLITFTALGVNSPIQGIFTHGFIINENDSKKLSKSSLSHGQANELLSKYGADTLRLFIASSDFHQRDIFLSSLSLDRARDIRSRICNTFKFILGLSQYMDRIDSIGGYIAPRYPLDEAVLRELEDLQRCARENYESFNYSRVVNRLKMFLKYLSTDYLSIIKDVIYTDVIDSPRAKSAFETLRFIGIILSQVIAPICPHIVQGFNDLFGIDNLHSKWIEFRVSNNYVTEMDLAHYLRELVMIQLNRAVDSQILRYFGQAKVIITAGSNIRQLIECWSGDEGEDLRLFLGVASIEIRNGDDDVKIEIEKVNWNKCDRCWLYRESVVGRSGDHVLCNRCYNIL